MQNTTIHTISYAPIQTAQAASSHWQQWGVLTVSKWVTGLFLPHCHSFPCMTPSYSTRATEHMAQTTLLQWCYWNVTHDPKIRCCKKIFDMENSLMRKHTYHTRNRNFSKVKQIVPAKAFGDATCCVWSWNQINNPFFLSKLSRTVKKWTQHSLHIQKIPWRSFSVSHWLLLPMTSFFPMLPMTLTQHEEVLFFSAEI